MQLCYVNFFLMLNCFLQILSFTFAFQESFWQEPPYRGSFTSNVPPESYFPYGGYYYQERPIIFVPKSEKRRYGWGSAVSHSKTGNPYFYEKKKKAGFNYPLQLRTTPMDYEKECNGMENLIMDIGLTSYYIGLTGFIIGLVDLGWSYAGQFFSLTSTWASYISAIPSAIITLFALSDPVSYFVANILSVISIAATIWSHIGVSPVGDISLLLGVLGEALGLVSIILGTFATYPHLIQKLIDKLVREKGREVQIFVDNYNCP